MSAIDIKVPPLGESVTDATVAKWLKKAGEAVKMADLLIELETDKVTLEINAPVDGVLAEIKLKEGTTVKVGDVLGVIEEGASAKAATPEPEKPKPVEKPAEKPAEKVPEAAHEKLSPAVRKMVEEKALEPGQIQGSGKDGRIIKEDVLTFQPAISATNVEDMQGREERVRMTRLRKTIATRLKDAQNTAAMLTSFNEIDMTNVMAVRAKYKDSFEKKYGTRLGFMSFFVKAAIVALKEIPVVNAEVKDDDIIYKNHYDISVAISAPQGLVVPVVRGADKLSFAQIEQTIADLSKKARDGDLAMDDLIGGTFTITNGGTFGSLLSTPIINPPQSGILGIHKIEDRAVVIDKTIQIRPMMYVALTYDHRIIDGRDAVLFLVRVKECIENPERILLTI
jgi:2-oxoglutarate dehydrogenase E2 component (dihydrolipoamide succinyltransferase)